MSIIFISLSLELQNATPLLFEMIYRVAGIRFFEAVHRNRRMSPSASLIELMFSRSLLSSIKALPEIKAKKPNSLELVMPEFKKVCVKI